jgi:hypothetical protein
LFKQAVEFIEANQDKLPDNTVFYCEYLQNPGHNTLRYERIPKNHLALFAISDNTEKFISSYNELKAWADKLDIDVVPLIYKGVIESADKIMEFLGTISYLGASNIEGVVVKNYNKSFLLGGQPIPLMSGKFVSETFKETNREGWAKENTSRGKWETFKLGFRTEARWQKAVQHLKEKSELENSPRDIGKLIAEVKKDIREEEENTIKDFLFKEFGDEILRYSTGGLPEWYKEKLLKENFNN